MPVISVYKINPLGDWFESSVLGCMSSLLVIIIIIIIIIIIQPSTKNCGQKWHKRWAYINLR